MTTNLNLSGVNTGQAVSELYVTLRCEVSWLLRQEKERRKYHNRKGRKNNVSSTSFYLNNKYLSQ